MSIKVIRVILTVVVVVYVLSFYVIAFISNRRHRKKDDILWISRSQWKALLVLWLPTIVWLLKIFIEGLKR